MLGTDGIEVHEWFLLTRWKYLSSLRSIIRLLRGRSPFTVLVRGSRFVVRVPRFMRRRADRATVHAKRRIRASTALTTNRNLNVNPRTVNAELSTAEPRPASPPIRQTLRDTDYDRPTWASPNLLCTSSNLGVTRGIVLDLRRAALAASFPLEFFVSRFTAPSALRQTHERRVDGGSPPGRHQPTHAAGSGTRDACRGWRCEGFHHGRKRRRQRRRRPVYPRAFSPRVPAVHRRQLRGNC